MRTLSLYFPVFFLIIALFLALSPPALCNNFSSITWESRPSVFRFSIVTETPMLYLIKDRSEREGYVAIDVLGITKKYENKILDLGDTRIPKVLIEDHPTENRVSFLFYPSAGILWKIQPGNNPQEIFVEFYTQSSSEIQTSSSTGTERKGGAAASPGHVLPSPPALFPSQNAKGYDASNPGAQPAGPPPPGNASTFPVQGKESQSQGKSPKSSEEQVRKLIIIDPGHGGFNKGARSYRKIKGKYYWEKDLVLQYALKLKSLMSQSSNVTALLTRSTDDYVSLTDRVEFAQNNEGDLFLSIHLNDSPNPHSRTARGLELFHWNETGSNNAADQYLEKLENDQMLPKLSQAQDTQLKRILAGMLKDALEEQKNRSARLCDMMWDSFRKSPYFEKYHRDPPVKSARFVVLANYAMPSLLVEAGFLSNYDEVLDRCRKSSLISPQLTLYKGKFNDTKNDLSKNLGERKIAIANIDSDLYESARDALAIIEPHLQVGTVIMFDDYNAFNGDNKKGERKAFNEFAGNSKWKFESWCQYMYTGQAFLCVDG